MTKTELEKLKALRSELDIHKTGYKITAERKRIAAEITTIINEAEDVELSPSQEDALDALEMIQTHAQPIIGIDEWYEVVHNFIQSCGNASGVSDEWVLVPVEPTETMKTVFNEYNNLRFHPGSTYRCEHTWKAVLKAAPKSGGAG